mmetsp:Transcript_8005/g.16097  ORF Transcript_8005/g.16097 Transcript_8005/m.16097 type:complete len:84 (+) Transcript_8005:40-291(+)
MKNGIVSVREELGLVLDMVRPKISKRVRRNVRKGFGIHRLFAMQEAVIRHCLELDRRGEPGDVVLSAPTGSGKTLAYAIPVVS